VRVTLLARSFSAQSYRLSILRSKGTVNVRSQLMPGVTPRL
jgi:hypothetical protein